MVSSSPEPRWYALHVRPNYELAVSTRLKELGVEEYLPLRKAPSVAQRNRFKDGLPLFPGYVFSFIHLESGPRLYTIPGLIKVLGYRGLPTPVSGDEISAIRILVESALPLEVGSLYEPGDGIYLTDGPLRGLRGTFIKTKKGGRFVVALPLLHRSVSTTVSAEWVAGLKYEVEREALPCSA